MFSPKDLEPLEKYYLMLLYAPDARGKLAQPIAGRTWCQKELFLVSKHVPELGENADYAPYIMGSYSEVVEEIQDQFYISGFTEMADGAIRLSLEGKKMAEATWMSADERERQVVSNVKTLLNDLSYLELLGLVYTEYPDSAIKSEMVAAVDSKRLQIALNLFRKGKVSAEKAAGIASLSTQEFSRILKEKGIDLAEAEENSILNDAELLQEIESSTEDSRAKRLVPWEKVETNR
jgi:predicted HTH domain antitoxin